MPQLLLLLLLVLSTAPSAPADMSKDRDECASTLVGLATCLSYVQGSSPQPTPDCCGGLKGVLSKNPKCLCVLVKDSDDPQLGVKINLTRAIMLPDSCQAASNISHCPELLNLPPNSPDARVFLNLTTGSAEGSSSAGLKGSGSSSAHEISHSTRKYNHQFMGKKQWRVVELSFFYLLLAVVIMWGYK